MITLSVTRYSVERYTTSTRITDVIRYYTYLNITKIFWKNIIGRFALRKYHQQQLGVI
jgi:hypothetical protein